MGGSNKSYDDGGVDDIEKDHILWLKAIFLFFFIFRVFYTFVRF